MATKKNMPHVPTSLARTSKPMVVGAAIGGRLPYMPAGLTCTHKPIYVGNQNPTRLVLGCSFEPFEISSGLFVAPTPLTTYGGQFVIVGASAESKTALGYAGGYFNVGSTNARLTKYLSGLAADTFDISGLADALIVRWIYGIDDGEFAITGQLPYACKTLLAFATPDLLCVTGDPAITHSIKKMCADGELVIGACAASQKMSIATTPLSTFKFMASGNLFKYIRTSGMDATICVRGEAPDALIVDVLRSIGSFDVLSSLPRTVLYSDAAALAEWNVLAAPAHGLRFSHAHPLGVRMTITGRADITIDYQCGFIPAGETEVMIDANGEKFLTARSD